jgi:3-hydroxyisobutyryl-CoA hydrolase
MLGHFPVEKFMDWTLGGVIGEMIDRCFKYDTIEEILSALEKETFSPDKKVADFAKKQLDSLKLMSPTSLKITLAQLRHGSKLDIASCFRMEYEMVKEFLTTPDFAEGVIAKLIEKRDPQWNPPFENMSQIKQGDLEQRYFTPKKEDRLKLLNRLSYYEYPHRTLSGLPTDRDVKRVINGEGRRGTKMIKPLTKKEVVEWIEQNWGRYDAGVIGEFNIPTTNTLDGGYGRGKVGLLEKVQAILERHCTESASGLQWK